MVLWRFMYKFLRGHISSTLLGIPLEVEFLEHVVTLCLSFWGTTRLFSKAVSSFYNHISNVWRFPFLCKPILIFFFKKLALFLKKLINLFIFGCVGPSPPCEGPPQLRQVGAPPHRGARASHYRGLSCCGAQAPDAQAQQLWLTGPVAHVACGIPPDQGSNPCPPHWQADSQPLRHQGSPKWGILRI